MNEKKAKKFQRLRKVRLWPSVLFFLFSLFLAAGAFVAFLALTMEDLAEERIAAACTDAMGTCRVFHAAPSREPELLQNVREAANAPEAMAVLDGNGVTLASYGEQSCAGEVKLSLSVDPEKSAYRLYADEDLADVIRAHGEDKLLQQGFKTAVLSLFGTDPNDPDEADGVALNGTLWDGAGLDRTLYRMKFWLETDLSGGRTARVKTSFTLYMRDLATALQRGALVLLIMGVPVLFFFLNVLFSLRDKRRMTKLLYTDPITTGSSYFYFEQTAGKKLRGARLQPGRILVADVTVKKYRNFCNYHGARMGETLLEDVDKQLRSRINRKERCAHMGEASFALLLFCGGKEAGVARVTDLVNSLTAQFSRSGVVFHAGICFGDGVAVQAAPGQEEDPAVWFGCARAARGALEDENVPGVYVYDDKILEDERWEHHVEERMQQALLQEEFQVYLQPKYDPVTEKIAGAEALVRWISPEDGFVPPGKFIPIFEKNGFITQLDDYMVSHVAQLQAQWLQEGKTVVPVSVNVSRAHFANAELARHICQLVDQYGVPHELIEIELTESAFFDNKPMLQKIVQELNAQGFEVSMDDFGSGYSSLNSLKDLQLDVLKLDAGFFRGEEEGDRGRIVVSEAIDLAKKLNMRIVAEGIEKQEQVRFLAEQGCDMIQGYYYAKPMPAAEYAAKL